MDAEDKLLGFKRQNYVSSSESEGEDNEEDSGKDSDDEQRNTKAAAEQEEPSLDLRVQGAKTGPKGVLEDYRRYRQLVSEQDEQKKAELQALAKKFSITCKTRAEEEKENDVMKELDVEEDEFVKSYHLKRLAELRNQAEQYVSSIRPTFGKLFETSGEDYLEAIDKENADVVVIMHLYEQGIEGCETMTGCLRVLAQEYPRVKFCQVHASETGISKYFVEHGLPALLAYQNKLLIGNYVQIMSTLGEDFYSTDVESFLIGNGILSENTPDMTTKLRTNKEEDSDSSD